MKKFKPVFLFRNEERINQALKNIQAGETFLNKFIALVEESLSTELDDKEKQELKEKGMAFIIEKLRSEFQFKKATDEFNLQALGIDLEPIKDFYNKYSHSWNYHYNLIEGGFKAPEQLLKDLEEKSSFYTINERQNDALRIAEDLKVQFIKAEAAGLVSKFRKSDIYNVTELLDYSLNVDMKPAWKVNYPYIKNLK